LVAGGAVAKNLLGFTVGLEEEDVEELFDALSGTGGGRLASVDVEAIDVGVGVAAFCFEAPVPGIFRSNCRRFSISLSLV
jgi:hypothetical protein